MSILQRKHPLVQLALDHLNVKIAIEIASEVIDEIDIIEAGTPLIKSEGIKSIEILKKQFSEKVVLADMKIMDTGAIEANLAFDHGADMVTVCAGAPDETIRAVIECAEERGKVAVVDMIGVKLLIKRIKELEKLMPHIIGVHTGIDQQRSGENPLENVAIVSRLTKIPISIAGGITASLLGKILPIKPAIVVIGSYITKAEKPISAAKEIREIICSSGRF